MQRLSRRRGHFGMLVIGGFGPAFHHVHGFEDGVNHRFVPNSSVDHDVVERPRGPIGIEVMLYVSNAFEIDRIDLFLGILATKPFCHGAPYFLGAWSIEKNMESVGILAQ